MASRNSSKIGKTHLPDNTASQVGPKKRELRAFRLEDILDFLGSLASSFSLTWLLFGWLTPLQTTIGFVVVNFLLFVAIYGIITSVKNRKLEIRDRLVSVLLFSAGIILISALLFVVFYTLSRGQLALANWNFFTQSMEKAGPLDPLNVGGILHAVVGTLIQISIALALTIPLGITTAVFLNEIGGKFARFVRTIADAMTALPSIVAGLFVLSAFIRTGVVPRSGLAAALAITVMMLPIVIRASDVVLRLVANNLREASLALGASRWRTVWHIVLPTARSGLVTAVILGTARGIGETSPVLLTSGVSSVANYNPFEGPMISLPLQVFDFVKSPEPTMIARGFGTAATLLLVVLVLFALARSLGGRSPGNLSKQAQRAVRQKSIEDQKRIEILIANRKPKERASS
jgi:phosphate transport system permease protein